MKAAKEEEELLLKSSKKIRFRCPIKIRDEPERCLTKEEVAADIERFF